MVSRIMKRRISYIDKKDLYNMVSWRKEIYKIRVDNDVIGRELQDILGIRGRGHGDRFIRIGIWLLVTPLLGISDIIGGIFIGLGLALKATSSEYSVKRVGSDLRFSIKFIKKFNEEILF